MSTLPNLKTLFIPHKTMRQVKQPEYGNDMRAIEIWARSQKAGASVGAVLFSMGAASAGEEAAWGSGPVSFVGTTTPQGLFYLPSGTGLPPAVQLSGTIVEAVIGSGGFAWTAAAAGTKTLFSAPVLDMGPFTGPTATVSFFLYFSAIEINGASPAANAMHVTSHQINLASGGTHLLSASDFNAATIVGTDLTFGGTPVALKTTAGNYPILVAWSISAIWDTANSYG